jgi:hypothetical protein
MHLESLSYGSSSHLLAVHVETQASLLCGHTESHLMLNLIPTSLKHHHPTISRTMSDTDQLTAM